MAPRLAILFHRLGPYHFARLRALGKYRHEVTVIEFSGVDHTYAWKPIKGADCFLRVTLFPDADSHTQPASKIVERVHAALDACRPEVVVIPGWADPEALAALQWCGLHDIPAIVMSETTAWDEPRKWWKEMIKRRIVSLFSACFVGGCPHREYMTNLGLRPERIFLGYDAVDNNYFASSAMKARVKDAEIRKRYGLPSHYFLASARFIEKKNLPRLLQAYAEYRRKAEILWKENPLNEIGSLVLLGDGPLRSTLEKQLAEVNLGKHVKLPGFIQYEELPFYYGLADSFIHISTTEPWGLVVNEAMASGLPVLVSNRCGCAFDLVTEGVNGFTVDPYEVGEIADKMLLLSSRAPEVSNFGAASQQAITNWSPSRFAEGLSKAIELALSGPAPRRKWLDRATLWLLIRR